VYSRRIKSRSFTLHRVSVADLNSRVQMIETSVTRESADESSLCHIDGVSNSFGVEELRRWGLELGSHSRAFAQRPCFTSPSLTGRSVRFRYPEDSARMQPHHSASPTLLLVHNDYVSCIRSEHVVSLIFNSLDRSR
jgi:hypothetical protein